MRTSGLTFSFGELPNATFIDIVVEDRNIPWLTLCFVALVLDAAESITFASQDHTKLLTVRAGEGLTRYVQGRLRRHGEQVDVEFGPDTIAGMADKFLRISLDGYITFNQVYVEWESPVGHTVLFYFYLNPGLIGIRPEEGWARMGLPGRADNPLRSHQRSGRRRQHRPDGTPKP